MTKTNTVSQNNFRYIDYKVGEIQNKSKHLCLKHTMTFKSFCGHLEAVFYRLFLPTSCDWNQQRVDDAGGCGDYGATRYCEPTSNDGVGTSLNHFRPETLTLALVAITQ